MGIFSKKAAETPVFDAPTSVIEDLTGDYTIDPAHTHIGFSARHAMVTTVRGKFNDFSGTAHIDTLSQTVTARLQRWGGIPSEPLHVPPPQRAYRCDEYGDYIFAVSRLAPLKRLSLLIEALANPEAAGIRCVIAGEGEERARLEQAISARGLGSRVQLVGRIDDAIGALA